MHKLLLDRPTSGFPMSIGTSLSIESIFNPVSEVYDANREVEKVHNIEQYSVFAFNASTILRNILTSIPYHELVQIPRADIYTALLEEIDFLSNHFQYNNLPFKLYIHTYAYVKSTYENKNKLRTSSTEKQIYLDNLVTYCLDKLKKEDDVDVFHKDVKYHKEDICLLFTHIPFDLLSHHNFLKLDLLESHTGVVKSRVDWNTKYYPIPDHDMTFLPFMEYLLNVFGDKIMFKPSPLKERIDLWKSLKAKRVTPITSEFSMNLILG